MVATSVAAVLSTGENVVFPTPVYDSPILTIYNPYELWRLNPSYIAAEYFYFIFAAATFYHAFTHRNAGNSLGLWLGCLFSGAIVELFTILSPQIGNFYHTQASVMVAGRTEPLYMLLGCYGGIQYLAVQLAFTTALDVNQNLFRKLGLSLLSGVSYSLFVPSFDLGHLRSSWKIFMVFARHHRCPYALVPIASSFWILSETACIGLVYSYMRLRSALSISVTMAVMVPLLLNIPFMVLYHPIVELYGRPEMPLYLMEAAGAVAALLLVTGQRPLNTSRHVFGMAVAFIVAHAVTLLVYRNWAPYNLRYSYGQPFVHRDCHGEMETVFWGTMTRGSFLCPEKISADMLFTLGCLSEVPAEGRWYWLCGVEMSPEALMEITVELAKASALVMFIFAAARSNKDKAD